MYLQKLIGNMYSVIVEILLWLIPIAGFIVSGISSRVLYGGGFNIGLALVGVIVGLILDVILLGPVIILFNIRSSLKNIENK